MAVHVMRLFDFFVYGTKTGAGNVLLDRHGGSPASTVRVVL